MLHQYSQIPGNSDFLPKFPPKRQHGGAETLYILVTDASWGGPPESVASLPSWSCGFDSRRPLRFLPGPAQGSFLVNGPHLTETRSSSACPICATGAPASCTLLAAFLVFYRFVRGVSYLVTLAYPDEGRLCPVA